MAPPKGRPASLASTPGPLYRSRAENWTGDPNLASLDDLYERAIPIPFCGCWVWDRGLNGAGYGETVLGPRQPGTTGRRRFVHVVAYEMVNGLVPPGLELDHLCRVRACFNPSHLQAVTHAVNLFRGATIMHRRKAQTVCKRGHPLNGHNLILRKGGRRNCRICCYDSIQRYQQRKKMR
jgi:HNH endonuclease